MKVRIELTPYNAVAILSFCREFVNEEETGDRPEFKAITEAVKEMEEQVVRQMSDEKFEDAMAENEVNILIGRSPKLRKRDWPGRKDDNENF